GGLDHSFQRTALSKQPSALWGWLQQVVVVLHLEEMSRLSPLILLLSGLTLAGQTAPNAPDQTESGIPPGSTIGKPGAAGLVISGRVVASGSGDRLRHARVSATAPFGEVPATLTDENGGYSLGGLPRGRYMVTAVKAGFVKETSSVEVSDAVAGNP